MTFTYNERISLFWRAVLWFETLTYHIAASPSPGMHALKMFDRFCFQNVYYQTEMVLAKMMQVNRPINCVEFI